MAADASADAAAYIIWLLMYVHFPPDKNGSSGLGLFLAAFQNVAANLPYNIFDFGNLYVLFTFSAKL